MQASVQTSKSHSFRFEPVVRGLVIGAFLVWTLGPVALIVFTSFKDPIDIFTGAPRIIFQPTLKNYSNAVLHTDFLRYFMNSVIVALCTTAFSLLFGTAAAYSLSRLSIPGARFVSLGILICRMVPSIALVLPIYGLMQNISLLNTYAAAIIAHTTFSLPFVIWMMQSFFADVIVELEEAAQIDGCSRWMVFLHIALPLATPALAATAVLCILFSWNEFLFSVVLTGVNTRTLPVTIFSFVGAESVDWGGSSAAATVIMLPMIVLGLLVQKYLARGLTLGAIKG
ncbi:ABC transporter permease [Reticulibacter mediterranei]|uniref:ABC transporter permease n=1 Tax=Reticulibacter mediterranei TaxID=2778369 RepID=A0A8J3MZH4_9CHLR|nr:carbohydrate ABC transporter permease [Reticulibacter mediterranei]GHO90458.1 ABC transporter permease [Reticulibacter mediterranei]